jgi:nicotinamide riboside kinase
MENVKKQIKVAVTGGPSGGKTTLIDALKKEFSPRIKVVPEAASILYKGGFPRVKSYDGYYHAQKAIYSVQKEIEDLRCKLYPEALIVCDRGSLDSLAYWPDSVEHFFTTMNTSLEQEASRYDWIIHLDTAREPDYDMSNEVRTENFSEALMLNEKIKKSWQFHKQRIIISSEQDFFSKMKKATLVIEAILSYKKYSEVLKISEC